jgi:ribosomal protein S21
MSKCVHVEVIKKPNEDESKLIKRFLKKTQKSKILIKVMEKVFYRKPSEVKRLDKKRSINKRKKAQQKQVSIDVDTK